MIYTLTLNPSLDYTVKLNSFNEGKLNLTEEEYKLAGGKGINVSQVLKNLGHNSVALGYLGGFTGKFIEDSLKEKSITTDFIAVKGDTRINVKMKNNSTETEINGNSPEITVENQEELFKKLEALKSGDTLVLAGSVPNTLPSDIYIKIMESMDKNVKVILDTRTEILKKTSKLKPYLVKPNHHELEEIFERKLETIEEIIEYGKKLKDEGPENVIVSLGGDGAILITGDKVYTSNVPKGKLVNSVGAGDSLVGGFIAGLEEGLLITEAFRYGIASGSATAYSKALCTKEKMQELLKQVVLTEKL